MRALVTGGAGFIGSHLVQALVARGDQVSVIDDLSSGDPSRLDRFRDIVNFVEASVLDRKALAGAMDGCEVVFHLAAIPSVERSVIDPSHTNEVNVGGTIEVMLAAAACDVRRVVFASSAAVYGVPATLPCRETMATRPVSPYGVSKLAAELYMHTVGAHRGTETVALRYFNVFGPGQDPRSEYAAVVPRFVTAVISGTTPTVFGSGEATRDYVFVGDVVAANLLAAAPDRPSGMTYNIAAGHQYTVLELLESISRHAGVQVSARHEPARLGDIEHSAADISLATDKLGYTTSFGFEEGIARTVAAYRQTI